MKYLIVLLLLPVFSAAQDKELASIFPMKDGAIIYERIVVADSMGKDQLYSKAKNWVVSNRPVRDASFIDDQANATISSNMNFSQLLALKVPMQRDSMRIEQQYWYNLKVYSKDGKIKIVADNLKFAGNGDGSGLYKVEDYRTQIETLYKGLLSKSYMNKFMAAVYADFRKANAHILSDMAAIEAAVKTEASKSDW